MGIGCDCICFGGWRLLLLSWRSWAASGLSGERELCIGAGPQRDAVVPFGNLPGARRQARTEFHPVSVRAGRRDLKRCGKKRCEDGVLVARFSRAGWDLCAHCLAGKGGSWDDPTGTQRGVLGVASVPSLLEMHPRVSVSPIPPRGEESTQMRQILLFLCMGSAKQSLLHRPCSRGLGDSGADAALDSAAKGQGFCHRVSRYLSL